MAPFSATSLKNLIGVHPTLVAQLTEFTDWYDISIVGGVRSEDEQEKDVAQGLSKTLDSKHLVQSDGYGHAADFQPTPAEWDTSKPATINGRPITAYEVECIGMLFAFKGWCKARGIDVRIGADWKDLNKWRLNTFQDLDHAELK